MGALALLITRVTKRQFAMATTSEQMSALLDRTIAFATAEVPYISEQDVAEIAQSIPDVPSAGSGGIAQTEDENPPEGVSGPQEGTYDETDDDTEDA